MTVDNGFVIAPWWQTGWLIFDSTTPANTQFYFRAKQRSNDQYRNDADQVFYNNQPWPVFVDEFRFCSFNEQQGPGNATDFYGLFAIRAQSSKYGHLWDEWAHLTSLFNAPPERFSSGIIRYQSRLILPQPLYLTAEDNFFTRVYPGFQQTNDVENFQIALQGYDPENKAPIMRVSDLNNIAAGSQSDFTLTNDRDKANRAMMLEAITFGATGSQGRGFLSDLEIEFNPPKGPRWTNDVTTPMGILYDQVKTPLYFGIGGGGIHIPASPYVIEPGGNFYVEAQLLKPAGDQNSGSKFSLACCLYGHQIVPRDYYR